MKKYFNIKTIILAIIILVIIAGATILKVYGFEKSLRYKEGKRIEVSIPGGYKQQDIIEIAQKCFNTEKILFFKVEKANNVAGIKLSEYTEAQFENYIFEISEKYEIDEEKIEYHEIAVPETKFETIIEPYILPVIIITVLSLIYFLIKNYKLENKVKMSLKILGILVITLCIYFSIIALFRLQIGIYTMPFALSLYIVTLLIAINKVCE